MSPPFLLQHAEDVRGLRVTVMGLGTFGGGVGAVQFLVQNGAEVLVSDQRDAEALAAPLEELSDLTNVEYRLGGHDWSHFETADLVVANPAIPPASEFLRRIRAAGIAETSEIALFWQLNPGRVVAVTGSNGKSTTTALIHTLIDTAGMRTWLGGNIGHSLLPSVDQIQPDDIVVLELSSFQLESLNAIQAAPEIAVVTSFAPNHLDWHGTLEKYRRAKQSILRWQKETDWCVLNGTDEVASWNGAARRVITQDADATHHAIEDGDEFVLRINGSESRVTVSDLPLRGGHNRSNALCALSAARLAGAPAESLSAGLRAFRPLPHRLEPVGEWQGRQFFNDSIATTPESAIAALQSFNEPIVLLAGGYDKGVDSTALVEEIVMRARGVALLGQTADRLQSAIDAFNDRPASLVASDFESAFRWSVEQSRPGDVVLLSPGHASYGWFSSFQERGEQFRALVDELSCPR